MKKTIVITICLMLIPVLVSAKSIIIMGWDGAGLRNALPMMENGDLPNLKSLVENGGHFIPIEITDRTVTIPSWTQVFTGLTQDQTGVYGNGRPPEGEVTPKNINAFPYWLHKLDYERMVQSKLQNIGVKTGWIISKKGFLGSNCMSSPICEIGIHANTKWESGFTVGGPDYMPGMTAKVQKVLKNFADQDLFLFVHTNPDAFGHKYGENSVEYLNEFKRSDTLLGIILNSIDRNSIKVIVMSDHGFNEGLKNHGNAPDAFLATDLPIVLHYGNMRDITPTVLDWYGIEKSPNIRGKSLLKEIVDWR